MSIRSAVKETILAALPAELDALAGEAMAEWQVPSVAMAVVQNGETVLLKACGQRDVEAGLATTPETQFTICSITKTFTATGLAMLVEAHRHYETFDVPFLPFELNPDGLAISFTTDRDGNVTSLSAQLEPMVADIVFTRVPSGDCMDAGFREARVGRYRHGSIVHVVSLQADGQLTLKPDYQPLYHLRPYQGALFSILELEGFRVEFRRGATRSADELVFHQPNGIFIAQRIESDEVSS